MTYVICVNDETVETGEWVIGPFKSYHDAQDWAERNPILIGKDWCADELVSPEFYNQSNNVI